MTFSFIFGLFIVSIIYAYSLYKKRQLISLKETYYSEIKAVFEVTKKANKRASDQLYLVAEWANNDLPSIITMKVSTNPDIADLIEKYNLDEKVYLTIFSNISDDIIEKITERFSSAALEIQRAYAEELSKLVEKEKRNVSKA